MQRIAATAHGRTDGGLLLTVSRPVFPVAVTGFSVSRPVFTATDPAPTHSSGRVPIIIQCVLCRLDGHWRRPTRNFVIVPSRLCKRFVTFYPYFCTVRAIGLPGISCGQRTGKASFHQAKAKRTTDGNRPRDGPARNEKTPRLSRPLWTAQPSVLAKAPFLVKGAGLVFHAVGRK